MPDGPLHKNQTGANLHVPGYQQSSDPGAVGAGKFWIDTTGGTGAWALKVRNAGDSGWETVATAGSGLTATSQAQMEAASDNTVGATPGRLKYHPGVAKAWASVDCTGTVTILGSYNVSSVTDNGLGDFTFNFSTAFSAATYAALLSQTDDTAGGITSGVVVGHTGGKAVGSFRVDALNSSASAFFDSDDLFGSFFGDQ